MLKPNCSKYILVFLLFGLRKLRSCYIDLRPFENCCIVLVPAMHSLISAFSHCLHCFPSWVLNSQSHLFLARNSIETDEAAFFVANFNLKIYTFLKIYIYDFQRQLRFYSSGTHLCVLYLKDDPSYQSYNCVFVNCYHLTEFLSLNKIQRGI